MQQCHPPVAGLQIGEHERVHHAAGHQAADVLTGVGLLGDDKHPVVPVRGRPHQRLQELHHDQVGGLQLDRRHEVGQLHRPADSHAARAVMRVVAELVHRLEHPGPRGLADPAAAVQHVRHRRLADAGDAGHVHNRDLPLGRVRGLACWRCHCSPSWF